MQTIRNVELVKDLDSERFAWGGLAHYMNREICKHSIQELHDLPDHQKKNVEKQAEQMRQSVLLAKEYYESVRHATIAIKPVLLYYSCMSLVLAEILLKQDGNSSLDRARGEHSHHGLIFTNNLQNTNNLEEALESLRCRPMKNEGASCME